MTTTTTNKHTYGVDAITIKISVIDYDRLSGAKLFSTSIVDFSSQKQYPICSERKPIYI
jgi:hypothetical protein